MGVLGPFHSHLLPKPFSMQNNERTSALREENELFLGSGAKDATRETTALPVHHQRMVRYALLVLALFVGAAFTTNIATRMAVPAAPKPGTVSLLVEEHNKHLGKEDTGEKDDEEGKDDEEEAEEKDKGKD